MPYQKLTFKPGINSQRTQLLNEGGWSVSNCIRFREGVPEVLGGWISFITAVLNGVCRGAHSWSTLAGIATMGCGTQTYLYVIQVGTLYDVTPIAQTTTPSNPFTTQAGSTTVTVVDASLTATPTIGQRVLISGGAAVGGITLSGSYAIQMVLTPTSYTIAAASPAVSGATGGGSPTLSYLLAPGLVDAALLSGWGTGPWGGGAWGASLTSSSIYALPRIWTIDNFGEQMIACPRGGTIYVWLPSLGTATRALPITNAPTQVNAIFVSNGAEQVIALGSTPAAGGAFDPMLVSWCNSGDYTVWLAAANNDAGDFHLTDGSQLMWGGRAAQQNLIWSDTALFSMQFIGGLFVYSFNQLGSACGMIGPQAATIVNGVAFWMSKLNFMMYDGTVHTLDCTVWDLVFKNLNIMQASKIICAPNSQFDEVRWDYPSASGSGENDSFVIFNFVDNTWTFGSNAQSGAVIVSRTTWEDTSVFNSPVAFDAGGNTWLHEQENVYSAGTADMPWSIESGYVDIAMGEELMFVDQVLPDQILSGGTVDVTLLAQRYSADTPTTIAGLITTATEVLPMRIRGRQVAIEFANGGGALNQFWRHGAVRIRAAQDGRN